MNFLLENAKEIMYLCWGGGFLLLILFTIRSLIIATRILQKLDDLSDIFIEYIQKPLQFVIQISQLLSKLKKWFKK